MKQSPFLKLSILATALLAQMASGQILVSSGTYTQNFDSLANSGTANTNWTDNSTLLGWYAGRAGGTGGIILTNYRVDAGTLTSGSLYSYGAAGSTERALGSLGSNSSGNHGYGVRFTNDTANAQEVTISYTGEQWRNGGNATAQTLAFAYLIDANALVNVDPTNTLSWNSVTALNFVSPIATTTAAPLDGNADANRQVFSNVKLPSVVLPPGNELFLRWLDVNDSGNDHGLAIDDLTVAFQATANTTNPPSFVAQPQSQSVNLGNTATFTVQAGGTPPLFYQWSFNGGEIPGATGTALTLQLVNTDAAGDYTVTVTNVAGSITSSNAHLTVNIVTPIQTNIAYLRTLMDTNYYPSDRTNLYSVDGVVTTFVNMNSATNCQFYMEDATGAGISVFIRGSYFRPQAGDAVRVIGPLGQISGLFELELNGANPAHSAIIASNGLPLPEPKLFQFAQTNDVPFMETNVEGSVVIVSNVFLQSAGDVFGGSMGTNLNYTITNMSGQLFLLRVDSRISSVIGQTIPEFASSITGVMGQYDGSSPYTTGYQFMIRRIEDLVPGTPPVIVNPVPLQIVNKGTALELSWPVDSAGFVLQSRDSFGVATWQDVGQSPTVVGTTNVLNLGSPTGTKFYRLRHP